MTEGPEWGPIFDAIGRPAGGGRVKNTRVSLAEIQEAQDFQRERTGADVAVAFGGVDTGSDFDGWGYVSDWVTEKTEAIASLEEIAAAGLTTAAYVGDHTDMVTAPRTLMVYPAYTTGTAGSGTAAHTHPMNLSFNCPLAKPGYANGIGAPSLGDIWFTPVVADRESYVTKLRWVGGADPSIFGMQWYEIALMIYDPSSGDLVKVWTSGNIKDTTAAASTLQELEVDMTAAAPGTGGTGPISQQVSPSQILFIAIQQVAPGFGQSARSVGYVPQANIGRPSSLILDASVYIAPLYTQGIPSSIAFSSLTKNNTFIPWGAVATSVDAP